MQDLPNLLYTLLEFELVTEYYHRSLLHRYLLKKKFRSAPWALVLLLADVNLNLDMLAHPTSLDHCNALQFVYPVYLVLTTLPSTLTYINPTRCTAHLIHCHTKQPH